MWPNLCHHVPGSTQSSHGDVAFVCCMPSTPMRRMGMRSATHPVRTTIIRCRILRYQHYAKGLLVCFKKGYQGGKRRPAFKMCANAAQDTIRNRALWIPPKLCTQPANISKYSYVYVYYVRLRKQSRSKHTSHSVIIRLACVGIIDVKCLLCMCPCVVIMS
jgi:hypothetical protein